MTLINARSFRLAAGFYAGYRSTEWRTVEHSASVELIGMDTAGTLAGLFRERVRLS